MHSNYKGIGNCREILKLGFGELKSHAKIKLQGPFGGGNQDWYKFEIAVMIGAGIGITPYASILNDLVYGTSTNKFSGVACRKVYFLWICPCHRNYEWFIEVLRDVEECFVHGLRFL